MTTKSRVRDMYPRDRFDDLNDALVDAKQAGVIGDWCYQYNAGQRQPWGIRIDNTTMIVREATAWLADRMERAQR